MDYEVCDLGIHSPDYFQGFGCACTPYSNATYGIGSNPREALYECIELIGSGGTKLDLDALEKDILANYPDFNNDEFNEQNSVDEDSEDTYYHIGIRWNE